MRRLNKNGESIGPPRLPKKNSIFPGHYSAPVGCFVATTRDVPETYDTRSKTEFWTLAISRAWSRHEEYGKEVLGIPANLRLLAILPIGKPASPPQQAEKKPLEEISHLDRYGTRWEA